MNKGIKALLISCTSLSLLGMLFGGLVHSYELHALMFYGITGTFIGAVLAVELEPDFFRYPLFFKTLFSVAGCSFFAYIIGTSTNGFILAVLIGLLLGLTSSYWLKHFTFP